MGRRKKEEVYEQIEEEYEEEYEEENSFFDDMKKEIIGIIVIALAVLLGIGLFCGTDSGTLLDWISTGLGYLFGKLAILFPIMMIIYSLSVFKDPDKTFEFKYLLFGIVIMAILGSWVSLANIDNRELATQFGGIFAMVLSLGLYKLGGTVGGYIVLFAISALAFILLTRKSFVGLLKKGARTAKEGLTITRDSLGSRFGSQDDEEYDYEIEGEPLPQHSSQLQENTVSKKNFNFVIDGEDGEDDEEYDEEYDEDDENVEYEDEDDETDEDDVEEYDEDDVEIVDTNMEDGDEEIKPLAHENFFKKLFKHKAKKVEKQFDENVVEIMGKNENPEEVKKMFEESNEGIVDIAFWEQNSNVINPEEESDEEYDDDEEYEENDDEDIEYEEDDEDVEYEEDDEDGEYDEEYDEDDEDVEYEEDDEDDEDEEYEEDDDSDDREIEIGLPGTKIVKEVDVMGNTPKMKPVATTDKEKDSSDKYEQKIKVNDPHRKKKEIKLMGEDGEEDTVVVDEEEPIIPYVYPKMSFLQKPAPKKTGNSKKELKEKSELLEEILQSFKVNATVTGVTKGPAVTRFELELAKGVKVNTIQNLSEDIAMRMSSSGGVRIAPIPGKPAIGIEIANGESSSVYEREVLDTEDFKNAKSKLAVPLGKGIDGKIVVMDIAKMPHILIAGATGSGKSVCINTIITSIIYKAAPDEVKLIMVDPKVVELKMYSDIPHLLIPVVTEPKKAAAALNWAVAEMLDRYKLFSDNNVKNLQGYNELMEKEGKRKIPQIVIIIDELADLMMAAGKEVEDAICRLAQMARAAGMHLIIATQRPSVDVITGLIKANVPSRIAFAVSSNTDSRTILDCGGAEHLLGRGDMLYFPMGANKPLRVQGAYVDESEIEKIVDFIKGNQCAVYRNDVLQKIERDAEEKESKGKDVPQKDDDNNGEDPLLYDALELMNEIKKASITMFQRRFKIGYNRAANLMDLLEEKGYVGPDEGTKPRQVYFDAVRDALDYRD